MSRCPSPSGGTPILTRNRKRRSAIVLMSRGLPGLSVFLVRSCKRLYTRFVFVQPLGRASGRGYPRVMCGRVRLSSDVSEIKLVFAIPPHPPTPNFAPSRNAVPTDSLPVVRYDIRAGEGSLALLRCGLVPHWAKDINVGFANINAKAEGIETKPAFRDAFQRRPASYPLTALRMEKDCNRQAALCDRVGQPPPDGFGRPVGELALAGGRMGTHLCHYHHQAE